MGLRGPQRKPMDQRFWSMVRKSDGCWMWTGKPMRNGYGRIALPGDSNAGNGVIAAHRYSAMLHFGMFDNRLHVLHHCDTPLCVRPDHLFLGTHADNMADMARKNRARKERARSTAPN